MEYHIKLLSDNTTTVYGINNMHSNKSYLCHSIISEIWTWAEDKSIWITASYIPGKENYNADVESRKKQTKLEWMLNQKIFTKIISKFQFQPEIDLFASRLNAQLPVFVLYHPDPETMHINTFSISWQSRPFYAFLPFAVIGKVLGVFIFCFYKFCYFIECLKKYNAVEKTNIMLNAHTCKVNVWIKKKKGKYIFSKSICHISQTIHNIQ